MLRQNATALNKTSRCPSAVLPKFVIVLSSSRPFYHINSLNLITLICSICCSTHKCVYIRMNQHASGAMDPWEAVKPILADLWLTEKWELERIVREMRTYHNFYRV